MPALAANPRFDASAFEGYLRDGHTPVNEVYALPSVASFSRHSDSLPQWRAYCPQGNGISIGFDVSCLQRAKVSGDISINSSALERRIPVTFRRVKYVHNSDPATVGNVLKDMYQQAKDVKDRSWDPNHPLGDSFRTILEDEAATYKDISFESEQEFRLIAGPSNWRPTLLHFRATRSTLVPYLELNIPSSGIVISDKAGWNAIRSVTIGPNVNAELTAQSIKAFFLSKSMKVTTRITDVSYRDW
jgi:hypothetical protein